MSNTLPLSKLEYREAAEHIAELRKRVADSKKSQEPVHQVEAKSLASQILELKALFDSGILTADEFNSAKAKLIA